MAASYRRIKRGERPEAIAIQAAAYPIVSTVHATEHYKRVTGTQLRVVADRGELVASGRLLPLTVWLNGREIACTGIASLATLPERRRRGYMAAFMRGALAEMRETTPLSCLYPFDFDFYARFGWAIADEKRVVRIGPAALRLGGERGRVDRIVPSEDLNRMHREWGWRHNLTTLRDLYWLEHYVIRAGLSFAHPRQAFAWRPRRGADPEGYAVLTFENEQNGISAYNETMWVCDIAWLTPRARVGLLGFLADFDSQVRTVELEVASDDRILYELPAPDAAEVAIKASAMCRIVDVRAALDGAPVSGGDRELVFEVVDPHCRWNQRRWRARARGGAISITTTRSEPEVSLEIGALTQLVIGADAGTPELELLAAVSGGRTPYHCDHY